MTTKAKRLSLQSETLRTLTDHELLGAQGGWTPVFTVSVRFCDKAIKLTGQSAGIFGGITRAKDIFKPGPVQPKVVHPHSKSH